MEKLLKLELLGIVFIVVLGSFLHFTFELSKKNLFVATFSAVNESVWEHLKLAVFPAVFWMLVELKLLKQKPKNFLFAKIVGIFLMPLLIVVVFYSYKSILGRNFLVLDILTFVIAVIVGQTVSYKLMFLQNISKFYNKIAFIFLVVLIFSFLIFTFFSPRIFLFQESVSNGFGIE